jgi:galactose-1-phosphate uridylyltransferase
MPELRQNFFTKEWMSSSPRKGPSGPEELAPHRVVQPTRSLQHLRRRIEGLGFHEVIIDSPDHSRSTGLLSDAHVASILRVYRARYNSLSLDHRVNHITIFKNHGADAGASLPHPHSQPIATPVIPCQVRHRLFEVLRHYDDAGNAGSATGWSGRWKARRGW